MTADSRNDLQKMPPSAIWERLSHETDKAWAAFQVYRDLPLLGEKAERRTLANVTRKLGHNRKNQVEKWSSGYQWVDRSRAYDAHLGRIALTVREVGLKEYQQTVIHSLNLQLVVANEILDRSLAEMKDQMDAGKTPDPLDVKRLIGAIHEKDDLARRAANMPTGFFREEVSAYEEDILYIIGGDT